MRFLNVQNLALLTMFSGASLYATVINPTTGGSPVFVSATTLSSLGPLTFLQAVYANFNVVQSGNSGGTLAGTLETAVYKTPTGTLDFFYQITESTKDTKSISDLGSPILDQYGIPAGSTSVYSLSGVAGLGAGFQSSSIGASGLTATWTLGNDAITWLPLGMTPSKTSSVYSTIFVVTTQATLYSSDLASLQGGNLVAPTLGTASPAPEPGFYGVLGIGLSGLAFMIVRRRLTA